MTEFRCPLGDAALQPSKTWLFGPMVIPCGPAQASRGISKNSVTFLVVGSITAIPPGDVSALGAPLFAGMFCKNFPEAASYWHCSMPLVAFIPLAAVPPLNVSLPTTLYVLVFMKVT